MSSAHEVDVGRFQEQVNVALADLLTRPGDPAAVSRHGHPGERAV